MVPTDTEKFTFGSGRMCSFFARPLSRAAIGVIAAVAGSLTLAWFAFLVWLVLKGLSLM